ncbi:hypothetical protein [Planobacterium oryzisoli]|uniref:Lipoprotein n=1 Tax=Planobacterium oryzisoli TaxID=2771435 RepID=A0A930YWA1_9FLAO|nr:hypothetical protein [Planobacterium oryzisoli]MBF5027583.1 hypothetical protein [Planobacterium oryzisoli]
MRSIFFVSVLLLTVLGSCEKKEVTTAQNNVVQEITLNGTSQSFTPTEKELIVLNRDREEYSKGLLDEIKNVANFYTSSSKNDMVIYHLENPSSQLGYSFERSEWEGRSYIQMGIFTKSGSNLSTLQWLFYDPETKELYEFDLHAKKLQKFP